MYRRQIRPYRAEPADLDPGEIQRRRTAGVVIPTILKVKAGLGVGLQRADLGFLTGSSLQYEAGLLVVGVVEAVTQRIRHIRVTFAIAHADVVTDIAADAQAGF